MDTSSLLYTWLIIWRPRGVRSILPDSQASALRCLVLKCLSGTERRHKPKDVKQMAVSFPPAEFRFLWACLIGLALKGVIIVALCTQVMASETQESSKHLHFCWMSQIWTHKLCFVTVLCFLLSNGCLDTPCQAECQPCLDPAHNVTWVTGRIGNSGSGKAAAVQLVQLKISGRQPCAPGYSWCVHLFIHLINIYLNLLT